MILISSILERATHLLLLLFLLFLLLLCGSSWCGASSSRGRCSGCSTTTSHVGEELLDVLSSQGL
jgi:hypothetical protein